MSSTVLEFFIEFDEEESCFRAGAAVSGRLILKLSHSIAVQQLSAMLIGRGEINSPGKEGEAIKEDVTYTKSEWTTIAKPGKAIVEGTHSLPFKQRLPEALPGSIEGKYCNVRYMIKAVLVYLEGSSLRTISARRAFCVIETNDLSTLPLTLREPVYRSSVKKFGRFSCTGGHIKFTASVGRQAFVPGENVPINGRLENRSDKRVDKASATLFMITTYIGSRGQPSRSEKFEVCEEALALFVDPGAIIKIERNFSLPALVPSSALDPAAYTTGGGARRAPQNRRKSEPPQQKPKVDAFKRIIQISYELMLRVEITDDDVFDVFVPLVIGSVPFKVGKNKSLSTLTPTSTIKHDSTAPLYRQPRSEKPISIARSDEVYACDKLHLTHTNRYPFFADLPTSSKQSRKISTIVHLLRAEKTLRKAIIRQATDLLPDDQDPHAVNRAGAYHHKNDVELH